MKQFAIVLALLSLAVPAMAQKKNPPKDAPAAIPAPTPKPVPDELVTGLQQYNALSAVVTRIKAENGIDKLEAELQKEGQALLALAQKDGFHFDGTTNKWVENVPPPPTVVNQPAPKK